jgi:hypothetical protein
LDISAIQEHAPQARIYGGKIYYTLEGIHLSSRGFGPWRDGLDTSVKRRDTRDTHGKAYSINLEQSFCSLRGVASANPLILSSRSCRSPKYAQIRPATATGPRPKL